MKTNVSILTATTALLLAASGTLPVFAQGGAPAGKASKPAPAEPNSTYTRDVLPIFMGKCVRCHTPQGQLPNWCDYKTAFSHRKEIKRRVWDAFHGEYYKQPMPAGFSPEAAALTEEERALIKEWAETGGALGTPAAEGNPESKPERIEHGKRLFAAVCTPCHQATGQGIPGKFPPLAQSDFLNADKERAIRVLLHGRQGAITVNGQAFNNSMPRFPLSDADIASALTYVYNSFGNSGKEVTATEVKTLRAEKVNDAPAGPQNVAHNEAPSQFE